MRLEVLEKCQACSFFKVLYQSGNTFSVAETRMNNLTQIVFHRKRKTRRFDVILRLDFHASEQKKICTDFGNLVVFSFIFEKYHVKKRLF